MASGGTGIRRSSPCQSFANEHLRFRMQLRYPVTCLGYFLLVPRFLHVMYGAVLQIGKKNPQPYIVPGGRL